MTAQSAEKGRASAAAPIAAILEALGRFPLSIVELLLRIGVGAVFFKSGLNKTDNWELIVSLFADEYKVPVLSPELAASLGTFNELLMPVLLVLGLAARPAAAALLCMTFVIQVFVYPGNWTEHLFWAAALLYVLTRGPGQLSLDHLIRQRFLG
ncbi:MAG: DoxX family protein [Alphaproteobacteria bacterium]|nr:DoxX family protein [Alphaproteobacteria bacterium]